MQYRAIDGPHAAAKLGAHTRRVTRAKKNHVSLKIEPHSGCGKGADVLQISKIQFFASVMAPL